jgi:hypothetical protein
MPHQLGTYCRRQVLGYRPLPSPSIEDVAKVLILLKESTKFVAIDEQTNNQIMAVSSGIWVTATRKAPLPPPSRMACFNRQPLSMSHRPRCKDHIDPDLRKPLIMSFCRFYGLGSELVESRLARIPEIQYVSYDKPADAVIARGATLASSKR